MGGVKEAMAGVTVEPEIHDSTENGLQGGWIVTVYDNDYNTFSEVIAILILATGCTLEEAEMETWEIHNLGKSVVHHGAREVCERVAKVISRIGIRVEVSQE